MVLFLADIIVGLGGDLSRVGAPLTVGTEEAVFSRNCL